MPETQSSNKDSFGYLYHLETIRQSKVGITTDGKPVTAFIDGVDVGKGIANLPLYDRETGTFLSHQEAKEKFAPQLEAGEIRIFPYLKNKFEAGEDTLQNHPANIRAREEHQKIDLHFKKALDPKLVAYQDLHIPKQEESKFYDPLIDQYNKLKRTGQLLKKGGLQWWSGIQFNKAINIIEKRQKIAKEIAATGESKTLQELEDNIKWLEKALKWTNPDHPSYDALQGSINDKKLYLTDDASDYYFKKSILSRAAAQKIELSPETKNFLNEDSPNTIWEDFTAAPWTIMTELMLTQAPNYAAQIGGHIAGGLVAGPAGFAVAGGVVAGRLDYINRVVSALARYGVDINDLEAVKEAFNDEAFIKAIKDDALKGSLVLGSVASASSLLYPAAGLLSAKTSISPVLTRSTAIVAQPFLEGGGEAGAQKVEEGEVYEPRQVAAEVVGGLGPQMAEAVAYYTTVGDPSFNIDADIETPPELKPIESYQALLDKQTPLYSDDKKIIDPENELFKLPQTVFTTKAKTELYNILDPNEKRSQFGLENVEIGNLDDYEKALDLLTKKGLIKQSELKWSGLEELKSKMAKKFLGEAIQNEEGVWEIPEGKDQITLLDIEHQLYEHDIVQNMSTFELRGGTGIKFSDEPYWASEYGHEMVNMPYEFHNPDLTNSVPSDLPTLHDQIMVIDTGYVEAERDVGQGDFEVEGSVQIFKLADINHMFNDKPYMSQVIDEMADHFLDQYMEHIEELSANGKLSQKDQQLWDRLDAAPDLSIFESAHLFEATFHDSEWNYATARQAMENFLEDATNKGFIPWFDNLQDEGRGQPDEVEISNFKKSWEDLTEILQWTGFIYDEAYEDLSPIESWAKTYAEENNRYLYALDWQNEGLFTEATFAYESALEILAREYGDETPAGHVGYSRTLWSDYITAANKTRFESDPIGYVELGMMIAPRDKEGEAGHEPSMRPIGTYSAHSFPAGTFVHIRGGFYNPYQVGREYEKKTEDLTPIDRAKLSERRFRLGEVQSDWAQRNRKKIAEIEETFRLVRELDTESATIWTRVDSALSSELFALSKMMERHELWKKDSNNDWYLDRDLLLEVGKKKLEADFWTKYGREITDLDKVTLGHMVWDPVRVTEDPRHPNEIDPDKEPELLLLWGFDPYGTGLEQVSPASSLNDMSVKQAKDIDQRKSLAELAVTLETALENYWEELDEAMEKVDELPFQADWEAIGIKGVLTYMVDHGVNTLEIPWGNEQVELYGTGNLTKGTSYFYNRVLMNKLKFLKSFNIEPELHTTADFADSVKIVPLTSTDDPAVVSFSVQLMKDIEEGNEAGSVSKDLENLNQPLEHVFGDVITQSGKPLELAKWEDYYILRFDPELTKENRQWINTRDNWKSELANVSFRYVGPDGLHPLKGMTYTTKAKGKKGKSDNMIVIFDSLKSAEKIQKQWIDELNGNLGKGHRIITLNDEIKEAIIEGKLPLFSESWRPKFKNITSRPEIKLKTKAKRQTLLDINQRELKDIPTQIKDVAPFSEKNKEGFAAGLDSLLESGMPKLLVKSIDKFGQMPMKEKSGVIYLEDGIIAINQKELADAIEGQENARWSVTSLLAHEFGHIPDGINRMSEYNEGNYSEELLSWSSLYFWNQEMGLTGLENIRFGDTEIENFGPITQESFDLFNKNTEGLGEFFTYPFDDLTTAINSASEGNTGPLETLLAEVNAQMSSLYRLNPKLLEKHAPIAYKFYKGLDYELSTENKASPRAAKKIRNHFRSSSPTRSSEGLRPRNTGQDGKRSTREGGALYRMEGEGKNQDRLNNGRMVRLKFTASTPAIQATDKKWVQLSITDESGKVVGVARQIVGKTTEIRPKTPEFKKHLIDIGGVPDGVTDVFHFDTPSQKEINKLLNSNND